MIKIGIKRFIAALIDYGIFYFFIYAYIVTLGIPLGNGRFEVHGLIHFIIIFIVWCIYFPGLEASLGYTLGKGMFDLKVINNRGRRPDFSQTFKRHLLDIIDIFVIIFIFPIATKRNEDLQRMGDLWANTKVVMDIGDNQLNK